MQGDTGPKTCVWGVTWVHSRHRRRNTWTSCLSGLAQYFHPEGLFYPRAPPGSETDTQTEFIKVCVFHRRFIVWGEARWRNVGLPLCGVTNYILNVLIKIKCTYWQWLMLYNNQLLKDPTLQHGSTVMKGKSVSEKEQKSYITLCGVLCRQIKKQLFDVPVKYWL